MSNILAGLTVILVAAAWPAAADAAPLRDSNPRRATTACRADVVKFCPDLDVGMAGTRSAAICLRPYKTSLSRGCRSAMFTAQQ